MIELQNVFSKIESLPLEARDEKTWIEERVVHMENHPEKNRPWKEVQQRLQIISD